MDSQLAFSLGNDYIDDRKYKKYCQKRIADILMHKLTEINISMKIGILTHALTTNYGGILQNYALQQILKEKGYDPITIDYYYPTSIKVCILSFASRILRRIKGESIPLRAWTTSKENEIIAQNINKFITKYINRTRKCSISEISTTTSYGFDALIVGSDQVWRGGSRPVAKFFFSDFKYLDVPKVAYAASFGTDIWKYNSKETKECKELVKDFSGISVREGDAISLCEEYLNASAKLVLDPTLLISRSYYENLVEDSNLQPLKNNSMMVYILDNSSTKDCIVNIISQKLDLSINNVRSEKYFSEVGTSKIDKCIFPSIEEWLRGFMEAKYVVTDSFHGTVFSIIFNKPFVSIVNKQRGASRFYSLLNMFGLQDRLVYDISKVDELIGKKIDFDAVNNILTEKRNESINFLIQSLNK